jgi:hypothetical protein
MLGVAMHIFNHSIQKAEAEGFKTQG